MTSARELIPDIRWRLPGNVRTALDARIVPLLEAIRREGTLRAAVAAVGVSYRAAWGLLAAASDALGAPLAVMERGRGARLAPLGEQLLEGDAAARTALERAGVKVEIRARSRRAAAAGPERLRIAASHDLALAALRDLWQSEGALVLDLETRGSMESLAALRRGDATLAGFHVAADGLGGGDLQRRLDPRRDALVRFVRRRQGLIVPRGNAHRLRTLADVAKLRLRFVNRQRGSGTRVLVDQLMHAQGVDPGALRGYATEEFTHLAVAATIAAGKADAGLGLEAAARQFGLGFVPIAEERYLFACRRSVLARPAVQHFRELLASAAARRVVNGLAGYALDEPGEIADPAALHAA